MPEAVPTTAVRAADALARGVGRRAAVGWTHALAVLEHARTLGLADVPEATDPDRARQGLERLADAHPTLAAFADPNVTGLPAGPPALDAWQAAAAYWRQAPPVDADAHDRGFRLGDAYQELSDEARKGRALCQTPPWIADLLLELALEPALDKEAGGVGAEHARMIDPSCGTGHILMQALAKTFSWSPRSGRVPQRFNRDAQLHRAFAAVHGVDLDPYAALLARYRMLAYAAAVLRVPLAKVPASLSPQVAAADSLLDRTEPLLERGRYHAVVGNPPYITVADATLRERIRAAYPDVAHGRYSLALPFCELMFALAVPGSGRIAQLTTNAWMKREYGKRFIGEFLPRFDMQWVIDTSGCYIPGHGTPTAILVHQNRPPHGTTVRAVLGKQGEPRTPADPAKGLVWTAIADEVRFALSCDRLFRGMAAQHGDRDTAGFRRADLSQAAFLAALQGEAPPLFDVA